jgi:hypothetical protein
MRSRGQTAAAAAAAAAAEHNQEDLQSVTNLQSVQV